MNWQRYRPMALGDVFDEAFDLYKKNLPLLVLVSAVLLVPWQIALGLLRGLWGSLDYSDPISFVTSLVTVALLPIALSLLVYGVAVTALTAAASARYQDQPCTIRQAYRAPLRHLLPLVATIIFYELNLAFGYAFCFVGIVVVFVLFVFVAQVFVNEDKTAFRAFERSAALVRGQGMRVFATLLWLGALAGVLAMGIEAPIRYGISALLHIVPVTSGFSAGPASAGPVTRGQIISMISGGIAELLIIPFVVCVITVLYFDLRVRKEAYDIELMARELHYAPLSALGSYLPPAEIIVPTFARTPGGLPR